LTGSLPVKKKNNSVDLCPQANGCTVHTPVIHLHNGVEMLSLLIWLLIFRIVQFRKQLMLVFVQK